MIIRLDEWDYFVDHTPKRQKQYDPEGVDDGIRLFRSIHQGTKSLERQCNSTLICMESFIFDIKQLPFNS